MKIGLITSMKYGMTQFIFRDMEGLWCKGHEIRVFTLHNRPGLYQPRAEWPVTRVAPLQVAAGVFRQLFSAPRLFLPLLKEAWRDGGLVDLAAAAAFAAQIGDCDLIYAYFGDHKLFVGYYAKRLTGRPLAVTVRAYELYTNPNPTLFVKALAACDQVLTITDYNRTLLTEKYGVPADQIEIVRQIVDLDQFQARATIKILIVGFFAEKKGHDILFRALKALGRPDVECWVVGDTNQTVLGVDCRQQARDIGVDDQVAFFGAQKGNALRALYNACDIFCLPSRPDHQGGKEGFPNVIAEAMAFGKPVVSTYHAGIPEAIDIWLVDENSVEQLTAALEDACRSAARRAEIGAHNRRRAEQMFSPANNERLEAILAAAVAATPKEVA